LEKYGQVNFCSVINSVSKPDIFHNQENLPSDLQEKEKIGLAIFENKEDAVAAIKEVNGKIIDSNMKPLIIYLYFFVFFKFIDFCPKLHFLF